MVGAQQDIASAVICPLVFANMPKFVCKGFGLYPITGSGHHDTFQRLAAAESVFTYLLQCTWQVDMFQHFAVCKDPFGQHDQTLSKHHTFDSAARKTACTQLFDGIGHSDLYHFSVRKGTAAQFIDGKAAYLGRHSNNIVVARVTCYPYAAVP